MKEESQDLIFLYFILPKRNPKSSCEMENNVLDNSSSCFLAPISDSYLLIFFHFKNSEKIHIKISTLF